MKKLGIRILISIVIILHLAVFIFPNVSLAATKVDPKEYIPKGVDRLSDTVYKEAKRTTPYIIPWYYYALIEQESCITLTHSRCWNEKARLKNSREEGSGVGQLTRAWDSKGNLRFDNLSILSKKYIDLRELTWNNILTRPDLQVRAMVYLVKENYVRLSPVTDDMQRLAMTDAAYNGGIGHLLRERTACGLLKNCNPQLWFGHVANIRTVKSQKKIKIYGNKSAWMINREHVDNVFNIRLNKYGWYVIRRYY